MKLLAAYILYARDVEHLCYTFFMPLMWFCYILNSHFYCPDAFISTGLQHHTSGLFSGMSPPSNVTMCL